jgi:hypothetical protein
MPQNSNADARPPRRQARETRQRSAEAGGFDRDPIGEDEPDNGSGSSRPATLADIGDDVSGAASAATEQLGEAASTLGGTAREAARATLKAVSDQASALTSEIASEMSTVAETEKSRGADAILGFAKAIGRASAELDDQSPQIARAFRSAAESVESFSDSLRGERVSDLVAAGSDFARREPLAFFAGALVAGFALSRFVKSSSAAPASQSRTSPAGTGE